MGSKWRQFLLEEGYKYLHGATLREQIVLMGGKRWYCIYTQSSVWDTHYSPHKVSH
jgi:hypothetical protein